MKQEFQEKGKYMKVKEFLENFTGDNHIKIYDMHSFDTHRYNNANEAIRQFGYYTVREWKIIDNGLSNWDNYEAESLENAVDIIDGGFGILPLVG